MESNDTVVTTAQFEATGFVGAAQLLKDINTTDNPYGDYPSGSYPSGFIGVDGNLFFAANDGIIGRELWVSDGTTEGTTLLKDINTIDNPYNSYLPSSSPRNFTEFDDKLFFIADDGITGAELWVSNGTAEGTQLLKDINTNITEGPFSDYPASSYAYNFTEFDGQLFFTANDGTTGDELWVSDGTAEGTQLLKDINTTDSPYGDYPQSSFAGNFTELNGQLFFTANDGVTGNELWVSDGTAEGTQLLKDINTIESNYGNYPQSSNAFDLTAVDGQLFFTANDGTTGDELWVSDGTAEGTQLLKDINPGESPYGDYPASSNASNLTEVDGQLFFTADNGSTGQELWISDGTAEGTQLLKDINTTESRYGDYPVGSDASNFTEFAGQLFFTANDGITGNELWMSDGTAEGTQLLQDIRPGQDFNYISNLTVADDLLFFTANDGVTGNELWISDGTSDGTLLFQDIDPGFVGSSPSSLNVVGNQLFFTADDGITGDEPWIASIPNNLIVGDAEDNSLRGTAEDDLISGFGGNDVLRGRNGNDLINGDAGNDRILGNRGNDGLQGGSGDDQLIGNSGNDNLVGNTGADRLTGGAGNDSLNGGQGSDELRGSGGADTYIFGSDLLDGVADIDTIDGYQSADSFDFSGYLDAGGSIGVTRVSAGQLQLELGGEDIVDVFGRSRSLDAAESQLGE